MVAEQVKFQPSGFGTDQTVRHSQSKVSMYSRNYSRTPCWIRAEKIRGLGIPGDVGAVIPGLEVGSPDPPDRPWILLLDPYQPGEPGGKLARSRKNGIHLQSAELHQLSDGMSNMHDSWLPTTIQASQDPTRVQAMATSYKDFIKHLLQREVDRVKAGPGHSRGMMNPSRRPGLPTDNNDEAGHGDREETSRVGDNLSSQSVKVHGFLYGTEIEK
ncbi:hypothetical protein FPQ18DRAFT_406859 [Pyronema domesticum]|nr:hypothetical protein FPQ18DRAFT_406859 [Pyronema domesticum]